MDQYTTYHEDDRGEWLEPKGEYEARILGRLDDLMAQLDRGYGDLELGSTHVLDGAERRDLAERWKNDVGFLVTLLVFRTHTPAIRKKIEDLWGRLLSIQVFLYERDQDERFDAYLGPPETEESLAAALEDMGIDPEAEEG